MIHIGFNPKEYMGSLNMIYLLKKGFIPPDRYLDVHVENVQLDDVRIVCSTNCVD